MTFAELIVLLIVGASIYVLLRPLREKLETRLYRFFRSRNKSNVKKTVIDITDYSKKKGPDHEV